MPGKKAAITKTAKRALSETTPAKKTAKVESQYPVDGLIKGSSHPLVKDIRSAYVGNVINSEKQWNIISWNVNGLKALTAKFDALGTLCKTENPDVVCLQEIKMDDSQVVKYNNIVDGYQISWNCCQARKGYSGTACLIRNDVFKDVQVSTSEIPPEFNEEGRLQTIEFDTFYLINTYVPNSGSKLERLDYRVDEWDVMLREYITKLRKTKNVIWTGDLNVSHQEIDLKNPKNNHKTSGFTPQERNSFSTTLESGFIDTFRELHPNERDFFSYWGYRQNCRPRNVGWRLDYFVVNKDFYPKVSASSILPAYLGSDHCPIQLVASKS